jgi:hypothetical protein
MMRVLKKEIRSAIFDGWMIDANGYITNCAEKRYTFQSRWWKNWIAFLLEL